MAKAVTLAPGRDIFEYHESVIAEYRDKLAERPPDIEHLYPPVIIGPTWQRGEDGFWLRPQRTLGWDVLGWCGTWLKHGKDRDNKDIPWRFTLEQARFILWWYSLDDNGRFVYRDFILQRLKGWGKDPVVACLCAVELLGPCRFDGWDADGQPIAIDNKQAWVQTAAVSLEQTKNTMRLLPALFSDEAKRTFDIHVGKETVYALGDTRFMQAVTSSPTTLEGNRGSAVFMNETQHWGPRNGGHDMAAVIRRNVAKAPDGASRTGRITNAYQPGLDSVAEQDREAWEKMEAGQVLTTGILYDSLEAPPNAPLTAEAVPHVIRAVRGDSHWLQVEAISQEVLDIRNPPSRSRRFFYNNIVAHEDAWVTVQELDACPEPQRPLDEDDRGVLFFDGSKSDDSTGLVFCRLEDRALFTRGCWQKPQGVAEWTVPRGDVDDIVRREFRLRDVVGFFADPGAGEDDETGVAYWDATIDGWSRDFGEKLCVWSVASGPDRHAVMWDMFGGGTRASQRTRLFTEACERALADLQSRAVPIDRNPLLRRHMLNARRRPNEWGISIGKETRMSARKIDLAVCAVGALMLARQYDGLPEDKKRQDARSPYEKHGLRRL